MYVHSGGGGGGVHGRGETIQGKKQGQKQEKGKGKEGDLHSYIGCSAVHGRTGQDRYIYLERWLVVFARRRRREDGEEEGKRGVNVGVGVNGM